MKVIMGVFKTEQQAIDAIQQLEQHGAVPSEIQVFAKNSEHSRRIERETDVHADEMQELVHTDRDADDVPVMAVMPTGFSSGSVGYVSAGAGYAGGVFPGLWNGIGESEMQSRLQEIGLRGELAAACETALSDGAIVIALGMGEQGESKAVQAAEGTFRRCGAAQIISQ